MSETAGIRVDSVEGAGVECSEYDSAIAGGAAVAQIAGTYHKGRVELDDEVDWPDGTRVSVSDSEPESRFLKVEDWPDTPENRAELARRMAAMQPVMSPEEQAEFENVLAESKRFNIEAMRKQMGL